MTSPTSRGYPGHNPPQRDHSRHQSSPNCMWCLYIAILHFKFYMTYIIIMYFSTTCLLPSMCALCLQEYINGEYATPIWGSIQRWLKMTSGVGVG